MMRVVAAIVCLCAAYPAEGQSVETDVNGNLNLKAAGADVNIQVGNEDLVSLSDVIDTVAKAKRDLYADDVAGDATLLSTMIAVSGSQDQATGSLGEIRDLTETMESILDEIREDVNNQQGTLEDIRQHLGAMSGASVSLIQNCSLRDDACEFQNKENPDAIVLVGRKFIPVPGIYTCRFTISSTLGSSNVLFLETRGDVISENELACSLPTFTDRESFSSKFSVEVSVFEGPTLSVPVKGDQTLAITIISFGPTISQLKDLFYSPTELASGTLSVPLTVQDLDTGVSGLDFTTKFSGNIINKLDFNDKRLIITPKSSSSRGSADVTLTVTEKQDSSKTASHTFKVVFADHFSDCEDVLNSFGFAKTGTYSIALGGGSPIKMWCEFHGGVAWTMCGKFRPSLGLNSLENGFGRGNEAVQDLETPFSWTDGNNQASIDCRKLLGNGGATHMLSVCYNDDNNDGIKYRVNNLFESVAQNPTDLFDVSKDETYTNLVRENNKIHTWVYQDGQFVDVNNNDGDANLANRNAFEQSTNFALKDREGAVFLNAGAGTGSAHDTVFWGWKGPAAAGEDEAEWQDPNFYTAADRVQEGRGAPNLIQIGTIGKSRVLTASIKYYCDTSIMYFGKPGLPTY